MGDVRGQSEDDDAMIRRAVLSLVSGSLAVNCQAKARRR